MLWIASVIASYCQVKQLVKEKYPGPEPEPGEETNFGPETRAKETHSTPDQLRPKTNQSLSMKPSQSLSLSMLTD